MPHYQIYGLNLQANIALPGPVAIATPQSDVAVIEVILGSLPIWLTTKPQDTGNSPNWYVTPSNEAENIATTPAFQVWQVNCGGYFFCLYEDGTTFVVDRSGTQIWAIWPDDLTVEDTATYLLGPILGFVQRLRGTVCLHASAIAIDDRVVVLVGDAGAGKSTTAAAFARHGYSILSDDVVPLVDLGDNFLVQPAYPRIRLWDESVRALYGSAEALPRLVPTHPTWDKRYLDLNQVGYQFQSEPLPLGAIYYLNDRCEDAACPYIAPMDTQAQLLTLVTNTYTNYLLDKSLRASEFELLSRLVKHIPVRQITPHTNIDRLPDLISIVLRDFRANVTTKIDR
jgi:hypothetical protein